MVKVLKLHYYNLRTCKNGEQFRFIVSSIFFLIVLNTVINYTFYRNSLEPNVVLSDFARICSLIYCIFLLYTVIDLGKIGYIHYDKEVKNNYLTLYNILPVGRKNFFLGRAVFTLIVGAFIWAVSAVIPFTLIYGPYYKFLGVLKIHFFITSIILIGGIGLNAIFYTSKKGKYLTFLLSFSVYMVSDNPAIVASTNWIVIPVIFLLIVLCVFIWRYSRIDKSDLMVDKLTYKQRKSIATKVKKGE